MKLEELLRRSRPEASDRLVRALGARIVPDAQPRLVLRRALRVAVVSVAVLAALSAVGGLGYAASIVTKIVVDVSSDSTYSRQPALRTLVANAALAQYGTTTTTTSTTTTTTTTTTSGGGGGIGPAPTLDSAFPADGATVQSLTSFELIASTYVDWFNLSVTRPDNSVTTLDSRQGTSQIWSFDATAPGLYTITGAINANNGSGNVAIATHFTIYVPPSGGGGEPPPPVEAVAVPTQPGTLTSSDGMAMMVWPAHVFTEKTIVQMVPVPEAVIQNLPPNSLVVQVTAWTVSTNTPVKTLGGVLDVEFPHAPAGAVPFVSDDGKTWRPVPALPSPQLPAGQPDGYFRDAANTVHLFTRHLTYFALAQGVVTTLALQVVAPTRIWTTARTYLYVHLELTAPAKIATNWFAAGGATVPNATQKTHTLRAGATIVRLRLPRLQPGSYELVLTASGIGQSITTSTRVRIVKTQPAGLAVSKSRPVGLVVVRGTRPAAGNIASALGPKYAVTLALGSGLFTAVDPRRSNAGGLLVDLDQVPATLVAQLHLVFPELRIVALASNPAEAAAGRAAGATIVVAKPVSSAALAKTIRAFLPAKG